MHLYQRYSPRLFGSPLQKIFLGGFNPRTPPPLATGLDTDKSSVTAIERELHDLWPMCCVKIVEWILGPAEKLLASQTDIGDSFSAADELRKQHEQLELKCTVSM